MTRWMANSAFQRYSPSAWKSFFPFCLNKPFELLKSDIAYRGRVFDVRRDQVRLPNGELTTLDVVHHPGAVTIVPVDGKGGVLFVRQYRHPAETYLLELPAGSLEGGEAPAACAARELREEIGMAAGSLEEIGGFYLAPGYSTEYMHIFLAQDLISDPLEGDADEFLQVERHPLREVFDALDTGEFQDAKTLAALTLARLHFAPRM